MACGGKGEGVCVWAWDIEVRRRAHRMAMVAISLLGAVRSGPLCAAV